MSNKTTFKRLALGLVAALGIGLIGSGPSQAVPIDEALTLSASSATANVGETVTVTITNTYVSQFATADQTDSRVVVIAGPSTNGATIISSFSRTADSSNIVSLAALDAGRAERTEASGTSSFTHVVESATASITGSYTKVVYTLKFYNVQNSGTTASTVRFTITSRDRTLGTIHKSAFFDLTVNPTDKVGTAAKSLLWMNDTNVVGANAARGDSTLVVAAGLATGNVLVGQIWSEPRNAADTTTSVTGGSPDVEASIVLTVNGPGLLKKSTAAGALDSAFSKSVTIARGETANVYSDGTAGVGTITGSIGGVTLTQAAKKVTFGGPATEFTVKVESASVTRNATGAGAITFTAKDAAGNAVTSAAFQPTGTAKKFYAISSDTRVIGSKTATGVECSYVSARARFVCDLPAVESGTATIVIADTYTATSSSVGGASVKSSDITMTVAGAGWKGTIAFDKATYTPGEKAIITVTAKDYGDRNVTEGLKSTPFSSTKWKAASPSDFTSSSDITNLKTWVDGGFSSFFAGVDTAVVYMPSAAGTYTFQAITAGGTDAVDIVTFVVSDPAEEAANSALDAAQEATDAAIAATDAAILAQEAADEAASAAIAAQETAQAAVDAVTALSAEVTKLVAQLATLQKLLNRVAKRVGVKL
jgi:hypothetical protein